MSQIKYQTIVVVIISILLGAGLGASLSLYLVGPKIDALESKERYLGQQITYLDQNTTSRFNSINSINSELLKLNNNYNSLNEDIDNINSKLIEVNATLNDQIIKISQIKSSINDRSNMSYKLVYSMVGTNKTTSGNFTIRGNSINLVWDAEFSQTNGWIDIQLYRSNGTMLTRRTDSGVYSTLSSEVYNVEPGEYYVIVDASHIVKFNLTIWNFY